MDEEDDYTDEDRAELEEALLLRDLIDELRPKFTN